MIHNLQLLRAFAALSVVYLHVTSQAGLNLGVGVGNFGVDLFFVISGFTMSYVGNLPPGQFFLRRCIRILPLYWTATVGAFLVAWIAPTLIQSAAADVAQFCYSMIFMPYPNKFGILQPTLALGWTLNYEMYFYLLFTIGLLFTRRFAPLMASLLIVSMALMIRFLGIQDKVALFYADPIVGEFCFGVIVYYLVKAASGSDFLRMYSISARFALMCISIFAAVYLPLQERFAPGERILSAGIPAAILVFALILLERQWKTSVTDNWAVLLGDSSYVLYLIHPYIIYGVIRLFLSPSTMGAMELSVSVMALMLAAIFIAIGIHVFVERPALGYLRSKFIHRQLSPASQMS